MAKILNSKIPYKPPATENLIELIRDGLRKNADRTIIVDSVSGAEWTGREIEQTVCKIADFLLNDCEGFEKGSFCSIYSQPDDRTCILMLAIICTGGVYNLLTNSYSGHELHDTMVALRSKFLFGTKKDLEREQCHIEKTGVSIVSLDEACGGSCKSIEHLFGSTTTTSTTTLESLAKSVKISPELDYAVIQFSGGTTGKPKPIPRTHKNLCHLIASVNHEELMDLKPGVVVSGSLPLTHRPGLWALLASVVSGSTFVILNSVKDVKHVLSTVEKYRITDLSCSLPLLSSLGSQGPSLKDKFDTSSLERIFTSGSKIVHPDLPEQIVEGFKLKSLRQCFGMTESGWVFLIESSLSKDNYLTVGHVCPGMEAKIVDRETRQLLGPHKKGEVALRGPQIFPGYLTSEPGILNRSDFTEDGWFLIGDQASYDENELIYIRGRYKETVILENNAMFFLTDIEETISNHGAVAGVSVVRMADMSKDLHYDVVRAYVVLKEGVSLDEKDLLSFVRERNPEVVLSAGIKFIENFPRLTSGKVDKQLLSKGFE